MLLPVPTATSQRNLSPRALTAKIGTISYPMVLLDLGLAAFFQLFNTTLPGRVYSAQQAPYRAGKGQGLDLTSGLSD